MGALNVHVQVDEPPEMTLIETPDGPLVEFHYVLPGGTLDILMPMKVAWSFLARAAVERTRQEEINEPTR